MNERIKELAEQSGYGTRWTSTEQFEQFMEKFAELIVRECAVFVGDKKSIAVKQMFEYFGVEE